jgi:hypothetical protein
MTTHVHLCPGGSSPRIQMSLLAPLTMTGMTYCANIMTLVYFERRDQAVERIRSTDNMDRMISNKGLTDLNQFVSIVVRSGLSFAGCGFVGSSMTQVIRILCSDKVQLNNFTYLASGSHRDYQQNSTQSR